MNDHEIGVAGGGEKLCEGEWWEELFLRRGSGVGLVWEALLIEKKEGGCSGGGSGGYLQVEMHLHLELGPQH